MKFYLALIALFLAGAVTGVILVQSGDEEVASSKNRSEPAVSTATQENPALLQSNPFRPVRQEASSAAFSEERIDMLERQFQNLASRLDGIESRLQELSDQRESDATPGNELSVPDITTTDTLLDRVLTVDNLVKAGIDRQRAQEITNRKNRIDFMKLELQDRAIREGFLGTRSYRDELAELTAREVDLREELGEDDYDRFLFATGQRNRVTATSVMQGSPADQAGIRSGDVIFSYNGQRLFDWNELKSATTSGERGEYVNITVLRDGQQITLPIPRGPLGVRLGSTRLEPIN